MADLAPTSKVTAAGAGGALAIVLVWAAGLAGLDMPAEVAAAITVLVATAAGYLKTERKAPPAIPSGTGRRRAD